MGNLVGKYAEWETNEEDGDMTIEATNGVILLDNTESPTQRRIVAGEKRKRSDSVDANVEKEDEPTTKKPRSPGTRSPKVYYEELPADQVVAKFSLSAIPIIIDENNYSKLSKDELVNHPRRSSRQTPMKEEQDFVKSTPKGRRRSVVKQEPKDAADHERTPSPKKKLFATPKKVKEESPKRISPKKTSPKKSSTPKRAERTPKKASPKKGSPSPKKAAEPTPKRTRKPSARKSLM
jgi:hypothetical protein